MSTTANPQERDIVYCHQCENEWYRDEHGLACPECQSDFTEIVEAHHDPRQDEQHTPADTTPGHGQGEFYAPDPDEDDIDNLRLEETGPGRYRLRGTYRTDYTVGGGPQQGPGGLPGGLMGMVGNLLQGMVGGQQQQQQAQGQEQDAERQPGQQQGTQPLGRPASAPGSRPQSGGQQQAGGSNGPYIRHGHGPGYSYTIATSSNANMNFGGAGGNLFPRNANGPQPFNPQPQGVNEMLGQMIMNIGAMPGGPGMPGMRGPAGHPFHDHDDMHGGFGPFMFGTPPGAGGPGNFGGFANLLNMLGPMTGQAGDAVYSQEALDRVITQLMEQHQTGHAPGPASESAIRALPKKQISDKDLGENGKAECSICMDEVAIGTTVSVLPCQHWFHHECIKAWLSEHDTCPHCRQGIMPKEGEAGAAEGPVRSPGQAPMHDMRSPQYTRPNVPGAYPFPRQNSGSAQGDGSRQHPFTVPDSPTMRRRSTDDSGRRASNSGGMFSRMRDAFGRNNSGGGGGGGGAS